MSLLHRGGYRKLVVLCGLISLILIVGSRNPVCAQQTGKDRAVALFEQGNYSGAIQLLEPLHQQFSKDPQVNYYYGACLVESRCDLPKAVRILNEASLSNDYVTSYFYLGLAYHLQYQFDEAIIQYQRFIDQANSKLVKNHPAVFYLEACENARQLIRQATQIDSRNMLQVLLSDFENQLENNADGSIQFIDEGLKSKADTKLPRGYSFIQSSLKEEVYFASYGKDGKNGQDLVFNFKNEKGKWNKPRQLSEKFSTSKNEINPVISPNGEDLYFCSDGEGTMGGYDVFKSSFDSEKQEWTKPVNLGYPINTPFDDFLFIPDFEDNTALLATNRECSPDSAWLFTMDMTNIREADEISNYSLFSLFEEKKEVVEAGTAPLFKFPVPKKKAKSTFQLLYMEAEQDEKLIGEYLDFIGKELESCNNIGDFKQKNALKKQKDAKSLKSSMDHLTDKSSHSKVEDNYTIVNNDAIQLNAEAEFTFAYINQLKRYQKKIAELKKQAAGFRNELDAEEDVYPQWQSLKSARNQYNQFSEVFVPIEMEVVARQLEYTKKQDELNIIKEEIEKIKQANLDTEKELAIKQREVGETSGGNQDRLLKEIEDIKKKISQEKIKLQFAEAGQTDFQSQAEGIGTYLKNLKILNEELISMRGAGFDFSSYYPTDKPTSSLPVDSTEIVAGQASDLNLVYDFAGVSEQKVLSKLQLEKEGQKAFAKAFTLEKKAGKMEAEIQKLQDSHKQYEQEAKEVKSSKRKKIREKQKKINGKIKDLQVETYTCKVKSFGLKYPVLESRLNSLIAESSQPSDRAKLIQKTSKSQWEQGNRQWARTVKNKSKRIDSYTEGYQQIDSSYTGLLNTLAFYLDILPAPVLPEPEQEILPVQELDEDVKIISENITPEEEVEEVVVAEEEVPEKSEIWFTVQIGAYKTDEIPVRFNNILDIIVAPAPNGLYRFFSGKFETENMANDHKSEMKNAGISDAFVVAYQLDERISLTKARNLVEDGIGGKSNSITPEVQSLPSGSESFYTVQLGIFRNNPDFSKIPVKTQIFDQKLPTGLTKYMYGQFTDYAQALDAQATIRQSGLGDAFVVKVGSGSVSPASQPEKSEQPLVQETIQNSEIEDIQAYRGLFFTVQIGSFDMAQRASRFTGISPVYYHQINQYFKYYAGLFSTLEEAVAAKNQIRPSGFPDAFVVAFNEGEKISIDMANIHLKDKTLHTEPGQKIALSGKRPVNEGVGNQDKSNQKPEAKEFFYTIQIGILSSKLTDLSRIKVEPVYQFPVGTEKYRLTCGRYRSYESAREGKETALSAGYPDAYIIAYYQGENISLNEAAALSLNNESVIFAGEKKVTVRVENKPTPQRSKNGEIEYRIQIASFRDTAPMDLIESFIELAGSYKLSNFLDDNGMTVYTVGRFKTYGEATKARKYLIDNDAPGAFIIAFRGFQKIPVNEAIKLTEKD